MKSLGKYKKIIIWGHPLYSHTTSYVMHGYFKAFDRLGYETYHINTGMEDIKNAIIITESVVDGDVPLDKSNLYVLHNCDPAKYKEAGVRFVFLQVWTKDCLAYAEKINTYTYRAKDILLQPWATDLFPEEIDLDSVVRPISNKMYWVGTYVKGDKDFANGGAIDRFMIGLPGIKFVHIKPWGKPATFEENKQYIRESYVAPAIAGVWQKEVGYLPCRVWKNISYGHFGATNSESVRQVFNYHGEEVVYSDNETELAERCIEFKDHPHYYNIVRDQMAIVKEHHTFLNRAEQLIDFIKETI